ncbi:PD-(D/E)XK nuclease family protein [Sebaldella sp. S0638]|uniref:PD-(D/E)XK nuclease family protein n=1 Tax=Sebaldella sp. S0638 TaxID=2957809 RepID=UPI00209EC090|nr:PD-(D/E)XK nuclease family protein [Sebaldella sp. S0638]MCP1224304.1 PD-(D/E)XK nuclease family protein [Sebaldella sp. S0638]
MKISNIGYFGDFSEYMNKKNTVFVFSSPSDKAEFEKLYENEDITRENLFIFIGELREKLFYTDKVMLKEEKEQILFYEILDERERDFFKIENYFDSIDIASSFLNFYKELKEWGIKKLALKSENKRKVYEILEEMKVKYEKKLSELDYTNKLFLESPENFSTLFLKGYNDIVFVNHFNFTVFEKETAKSLEKEFSVEIVNQIDEEDYDNAELKIKKARMVFDKDKEISLYKSDNEILNVFDILERNKDMENLNLLVPDLENEIYFNLLSQSKANVKSRIYLKNTRFYTFFKYILDLLESKESHTEDFNINLKKFRNAISNKVFAAYYKIDVYFTETVDKIIQYDYIYITRNLVKHLNVSDIFKGKISAIFSDLENIFNTDNFLEVLEVMEKFNKSMLLDNRYTDDLDKYYEALNEIEAIEKLKIHRDWDSYFKPNGANFLKIILKYFDFKEVTLNIKEDSQEIMLDDFKSFRNEEKEKIVLFNIHEKNLYDINENLFFLGERERELNGLPSTEELKKFEKFRIFRFLNSAKLIDIYSLEIQDQNIFVSSLAEEIRIENNLKFNEIMFNESNIADILKEMFDEKRIEYKGNRDDTLYKSGPDRELKIGAYDFRDLKECHYRFYLKKMIGLKEFIEPQEKITSKSLGILIHEVFERISVAQKDKIIDTMKFDVNSTEVEKTIKDVIKSESEKISKKYGNYYEEIIFPIVTESVTEFFRSLERKIKDKIIVFEPEFKKERQITDNVKIVGKLDLLIETEKEHFIIDFKSGKGKLGQLYFYSNLIYENESAEKIIYDVLNMDVIDKDDGKDFLTMSDMKDVIDDFEKSDKYRRTDDPKNCRFCEYREICRMRYDNTK